MKRPDPKLVIAKNASEVMRRNGVSNSEIARRSGIALKTLNNILSGRHSTTVDNLDRLAKALGMPLKDLVDTKSPSVHPLHDLEPLSVVEESLLTKILQIIRTDYAPLVQWDGIDRRNKH